MIAEAPENRMLTAALRYASWGWHVFPVHAIGRDGICTCGGFNANPNCTPGKHPATKGGLLDATTDARTIREWWSKRPDLNIGLRCGEPSGVWVLDVDEGDGKSGGESFLRLRGAIGKVDAEIQAITGGGGTHHFYKWPGHPVKTTAQALGDAYPDIDVRGDGGYVVLPPSNHVSGRSYAWEASSDPEDGLTPQAAPEALLKLLAAARHPLERREIVQAEEIIVQGGRNEAIFKTASSLRGKGHTEAEILALCLVANRNRCRPPLTEDEVTKTVWSASKLEANRVPKDSPLRASIPPPPGPAPWRPKDWEARRLAQEAYEGLPEIECYKRELRDITLEALHAIIRLNEPASVFVRGRLMVTIASNSNGSSYIKTLIGPAMRSVLARKANWIETRGKERKVTHVFPPNDVVADMQALEPWPGLPILDNLSLCPVIAPNGAIRKEYGYHEPAKTYVAYQGDLEPWNGDGKSAVAWILEELLCDFPFVDNASRANALALLLLPFVRPCINGPTPLHLFDAPTQGTGKSLLAAVLLFAGLETVSATTVPKDEDSWRKQVTTALVEGVPAVFLDNISRKLDSESLASVLTTTRWADRLLGTNVQVDVPNMCTWVATSNNAKLSPDITRRTVYVRLDAGMERPQDRKGFRHPDILWFAAQQRARIISAVLAMLEAWVAAGRPYGTERMGSFPDWARIMGGILAVNGVEGFLENKEQLQESANTEDVAWRSIVSVWWEAHGPSPVTTRALCETLSTCEAFQEVSSGDSGDSKARSRFAKLLGYRVDKVFSGLRISKSTMLDGNNRFKLIETSGLRGHSLDISNPTHAGVRAHAHDARDTHTHDARVRVGGESGLGMSPKSTPLLDETSTDFGELII